MNANPRKTRRKPHQHIPQQGWMLTYSDLVTLLLAFFVLLVSMSSVDRVQFERMASSLRQPGDLAGTPEAPRTDVSKRLRDLLMDAEALSTNAVEIRSLLFPPQVLPPGVEARTVERDVEVLENPEGVVIALTHDLLFPQGQDRLPPASLRLLNTLTDVLAGLDADVNVSAHTDATEGGADPWDLSDRRALSVLEHFLQRGMDPARFSVSGYGPDRPLDASASPEAAQRNRRVEILVKTAKRPGRYG